MTYTGADLKKYVLERLEDGDLAAALHAVQDFNSAGHKDFAMFRGFLRKEMVGHILGDWCPSSRDSLQAVSDSMYVIRQFLATGGTLAPDPGVSIGEMGDMWRNLDY